jgi:hypothetical protein
MNPRTAMIIDELRPRFAISLLGGRVGSRVLATSSPVHLQCRLGGRNET